MMHSLPDPTILSKPVEAKTQNIVCGGKMIEQRNCTDQEEKHRTIDDY